MFPLLRMKLRAEAKIRISAARSPGPAGRIASFSFNDMP